jgi:predicted dehydrogenase
METVRIGFVGCGSHSTQNLYPMLKYARCTLQAVCDLNETLGRRNMEVFHAKAWYPTVDEMLDNSELDAVIAVGPPQLHYQAALKALRRGLPVLTEKPTAPTLAQAQEMVETAKANGAFLMTAFMKRHGMTYGKIREYITTGQFVPASCTMKYTHWPNTDLRTMLLFMCSHPIDLVLSFFGPPKRLQCTLGKNADGWLTLFVNLTFDQGRVAQLTLGSQVRIQEHFEISGSLAGKPAFFAVDNVDHMELHVQGRGGLDDNMDTLDQTHHDFDMQDIQVWRPDYGIPNLGQTRHFIQGFAGEIREFCNAILDNRPANPTMPEMLNTMRVIEAIAEKPDGTTEW